MAIKKIGILTGGGDCPGLNAVIRAVVKAAINQHNIEAIGIKDGYSGIVETNVIPLSNDDVSGILNQGGTILGTSNKADPYRYAIEMPDGSIKIENRIKETLANIEKLQIDALVAIGGDGTLSIAKQLYDDGVPVIGVPKTIDNDLGATDVTFGFDSALSVATDAVDRLHTTAESHHRTMVLEVMGRYAGWIALRSGIAGGGDVIILPEMPYDIDVVCESIQNRVAKGRKFSIVVVAEGAKAKGGELVVQRTVEGSPDPIRLGGIGHIIADDIEKRLGTESRVTVLGHLQRGGCPTAFDRWLATRFGARALEALVDGKYGEMVALHGQDIISVPIVDAVKQLRRVTPDSHEVKSAIAVGTCLGV